MWAADCVCNLVSRALYASKESKQCQPKQVSIGQWPLTKTPSPMNPISSNVPYATCTHICPADVEGEEAELDSHPTLRIA